MGIFSFRSRFPNRRYFLPARNSMSRNSRSTKQSSAPTEEKQFSSTIITNFLNNYYRNLAMKNPSTQSLNFKVFPADKANKVNQPVIDLYNYQGLLDFIAIYKAAQELPEAELSPSKLNEFVIERTSMIPRCHQDHSCQSQQK